MRNEQIEKRISTYYDWMIVQECDCCGAEMQMTIGSAFWIEESEQYFPKYYCSEKCADIQPCTFLSSSTLRINP